MFVKSFNMCYFLYLESIFFFFFFQFDALSWKNGVSCKVPIFTRSGISFSFRQNFMKLHSYIIMLPEGRAYSHRFVCPSFCPSFRPYVCPKPFLHNPLTKLDKTSYINSLGYCTEVVSLFFNLTLCHGKTGFLVLFQFLQIAHSVFVKIHETSPL